jgi:glycosyltransferase involved in cell wall biosynthesis
MPHPKVSVIMPTYNRAKRLKEAIESVLNQTLRDFELIIINDGSTDNTREVISKFKDKRIVYLEKKNGGPSSARNSGLLRAEGRYISYLDDDDIYYPCHLKILSRYLDINPDIGLIYGSAHFRSGRRVFKPYPFTYSQERLELDNFIPYNSLMHRKECLKKAGFFDENLSFAEDWDLWLRISDFYKISHLEKFVACVRFHETDKSDAAQDRYKSKSYMYVIQKRTGMKAAGVKGRLPFEGYYMELAYRLIFKFRTKKELCLKFMKKIVNTGNRNPEARMALCACCLVFNALDKAINAGFMAERYLTEKVTGDRFQGAVAFNVHRLLSRAFKRKKDYSRSLHELKEAARFITKDVSGLGTSVSITGTTSRFLNQLTGTPDLL